MVKQVTTFLEEYDKSELKGLIKIIQCLIDDEVPRDFLLKEVKIACFKSINQVIFINSESELAMINPKTDNLECYYNSPFSDKRGFISDLIEEKGRMTEPELLWLEERCKQNDEGDIT